MNVDKKIYPQVLIKQWMRDTGFGDPLGIFEKNNQLEKELEEIHSRVFSMVPILFVIAIILIGPSLLSLGLTDISKDKLHLEPWVLYMFAAGVFCCFIGVLIVLSSISYEKTIERKNKEVKTSFSLAEKFIADLDCVYKNMICPADASVGSLMHIADEQLRKIAGDIMRVQENDPLGDDEIQRLKKEFGDFFKALHSLHLVEGTYHRYFRRKEEAAT